MESLRAEVAGDKLMQADFITREMLLQRQAPSTLVRRFDELWPSGMLVSRDNVQRNVASGETINFPFTEMRRRGLIGAIFFKADPEGPLASGDEIIYYDGTRIHRYDLPAVRHLVNDREVIDEYWENGIRHRVSGVAIEYPTSLNRLNEYWFLNERVERNEVFKDYC